MKWPSNLDLYRILVAVILLSCLAPLPVHATDNSAYLVQWLQQPTVQIGSTVINTSDLRDFYASNGYQLLWVDDHGLTPRASQALGVIADASSHGLDPEQYATGTIRSVSQMSASDPAATISKNLSLEILASYAIMHYAGDMITGFAPHQWDTGKIQSTTDEQLALLKQATSIPNVGAFLGALAPNSAEYTALKKALQDYRLIASQGGWPVFVPGKIIQPQTDDPRLGALRQILVIGGDLDNNAPQTANYGDDLINAVKRFQERHGIHPDGIVNAITQKELAVPVSARIKQIMMTMERMRWMSHDLGPRYVIVNIPAYTLTAVAGDKQLNMDVIVGRPSSKTPMFSKTITDVIFNPSWGVPSKIAVKEMLPKIQKNPNYLIQAGYAVTENHGGASHAIDPRGINWTAIGQDNFPYSFRQNPGDGNVLGKVKFNIPDSDDIYLHDTSQHKLFARTERSLSHGCVRLSDPKALTQFILGSEGWTVDKIEITYDSRSPKTVPITPLPVHLVYWTSWVDSQGKIHFARDIYGMDKAMLAAFDDTKHQTAENTVTKKDARS